jgi:predicted AAA+ superfamily ATPase
MFRRLDEGLKKWKKDKHPKPLMLRGARQVGKSFLVEKFAKDLLHKNTGNNSKFVKPFSFTVFSWRNSSNS